MIIVFYNANQEKVYICDTNNKTTVVDANDTRVFDNIPNDDILYVTNGHYFTKQQFLDWMAGEYKINDATNTSKYAGIMNDSPVNANTGVPQKPRKYIHATANGVVLIEDLNPPVMLEGKWDFIAVDTIGEENLENSAFFRTLLKRGKIAYVDEKYVVENQHKKKTKKSPTEAALDKILIKDSTPGAADKVASSGGMSNGDDVAIPIIIE
jgi:hypothetical protein